MLMYEIHYKGFIIEIEKASNILKNSILYCSVVHSTEGWYLFDDVVRNNISEQITILKELIDRYLLNVGNWNFEEMKPID